MAKVVGVGGVFLRAKEPKTLTAWYVEHLGLPDRGGYVSFEGPEAQGTTAFSFFKERPEADEQAVVNFRVDSLDDVLDKLEALGVKVEPKREDYGFGKFGWFWDPEGNKGELWEAAAEEKDSSGAAPFQGGSGSARRRSESRRGFGRQLIVIRGSDCPSNVPLKRHASIR